MIDLGVQGGMISLAIVLVLVAEPPRVEAARRAHEAEIRSAFAAVGVAYPPDEIFLRAMKADRQLELWAGASGRPLRHVRTYSICALSGALGPKRAAGDGQVPEGFYRINRFNPFSNFHLSLGLDYPNDSDRRRGARRLGRDIFIHGDCVTIGCIPIRDAPIEELFVIATDAGNRGSISVHVFPGRMDSAGLKRIRRMAGDADAQQAFWNELKPAWDAFEATHRVPAIRIGPAGEYLVR